ncbi:MAG: 50S ribosomal protein L21 [Bdellovibrionales bacterium]
MFAIVRIGNQQVKVKAGDFVRGAFLKSSTDTVELPVIAVEEKGDFLFQKDQLKTARVKAKILREGLSKKVLVFKKKRRKGYRKTRGHRQKFTELQILEIAVGSSKSVLEASKVVKPRDAQDPKTKATAPLKKPAASKETKSQASKPKVSIAPQAKAAAPVKKSTAPKTKTAAPTKKPLKAVDKKVTKRKT